MRAEVKTLVLEDGERVVHCTMRSYLSRMTGAKAFQRYGVMAVNFADAGTLVNVHE